MRRHESADRQAPTTIALRCHGRELPAQFRHSRGPCHARRVHPVPWTHGHARDEPDALQEVPYDPVEGFAPTSLLNITPLARAGAAAPAAVPSATADPSSNAPPTPTRPRAMARSP